jgi:hypothetical protein
MTTEYPIDRVLRARKILLHGGTDEETHWAYEHLVDKIGAADPYDGRLPAAAGEALLKSGLRAFPEESLRRLTMILADTNFGVGLSKVAKLLVLLPMERALKYLPDAQQKIDAAKHLYNAASIAYVRAMHGDEQARSALISLARTSEKVPGAFLQQYYVRVLCHFPGNDGEAEWYFREGYRLLVPPEFSHKVDPSRTLRMLEMIRLPKAEFIVQKCRADFNVKDERTRITFLRPSGSFITEYGKYPGWDRLASEQRAAAETLLRQLINEEQYLLTRTTGICYHLDSDGFTLERLLTGWLDNPAPFRLF